MAAVGGPATPQRSLPGTFAMTPAPVGSTIFASNAATLRQNHQPVVAQNAGNAVRTSTLTVTQRGAQTINDTLASEERFPELESYITQGISGEYDFSSGQTWLPFQKLKMYDIPARLLEQANQSGMGMQMGIFAPLGHAWMALDNCLYLWDYSTPNPEIIGFEENTHTITSVKLVVPKAGVFVEQIRHMIVICTDAEMLLLGVGMATSTTGAQTIALYNTRMSIPIRGIGVGLIEASRKTGRIFFTGSNTDDIFEFQYQQEEGWFRGKCSRICHTRSSFSLVQDNMKAVGQFFSTQAESKSFEQMCIDDSRNLMYTLSSTNEIKVWLIKDRIEGSIARSMSTLLQHSSQFTGRTDLLAGKEVKISTLSVISATQARNVSLMATTNTGCRLYISIFRDYASQADAQNPPASMQVLHISFPPKASNDIPTAGPPGQLVRTSYNQPPSKVDIQSRVLTPTRMAYRFSPGYFMAILPIPGDNDRDRIFISAPDVARLKNPQDTSQINTRFAEFGQWLDLPASVQQIVSLDPDYAATGEPLGYANELAIQFDKASPEVAIMTSAGVLTLRRRRLVDVFAGMLKYGSTDEEGITGDVKRFIRSYGRGETAATALAVACGQGLDVTDSRVAFITEPEVLDKARKVFIEHGGKPDYNANAVVDQAAVPVESVRPSPRHEGMALYLSRLVRSIWKQTILKQTVVPGTGLKVDPVVSLEKLRLIQRDLTALRGFLRTNKSFIEGLAGPQALSRIQNRQEEIALQGEHRAMNSLVQLLIRITEGLSFVLVLFDERVEEIVTLLSDESKQKVKDLTFQALFATPGGRELAKELVKAIVNRNIANGSNVDTVADALRKRCGSFCSADDVMIFKAQEQLKRASEAGSQSEGGRALLNESQRLFQRVAASLTADVLRSACESYISMSFYAGAIQLCLTVADEKDKPKRALSWQRDGMPPQDPREQAYATRKACYSFIFQALQSLEIDTANAPEMIDGRYTVEARRRNEAYSIVNSSDDVVFLTTLYDWYCRADGLNNPDRLLEVETPYVVDYLRGKSQDERAHADLFWRYFLHRNDFLQAASVQLDIARSHFELSLEERIGYLSRARTNASTRQTALTDARQSKQRLLRDISDLLEIASVQDELLQRIKQDPRISDPRKLEIVRALNSQILSCEELFNKYADSGSYHDICIIIYQVADHRNSVDILNSWQQLITQSDLESSAVFGRQRKPWEAVSDKVRELGRRLNVDEATFPVGHLLPMLERYALQPRESRPPPNWALDVFLDLEVPYESLLPVLEQMYYSNEHPFTGSKRKQVSAGIVYLCSKWYEASFRNGDRIIFGSEESRSTVQDCLASLLRGDMDEDSRRIAEALIADMDRL